MFKSFLQTTEWLKFQEHIGHKTWQFPSVGSRPLGPVSTRLGEAGEARSEGAAGQVDDGKIRANIIQHKVAFGKNYLYIPHGPEIFFDNLSGGLKNEIENFVAYLKKLGKENKSIFIKFEPLTDVVAELVFRKGIKKSNKQVQPQKTVILNLDLSEEELLSRMHHKTRYNIRLAEKKGIRVEESGDTDAFWTLLKKTAKRDRFSTHTKDYYEKLFNFFNGDPSTDSISSLQAGSGQAKDLKTKIFFARYEDKPIAGLILMLYGDTVYYLHGAMDIGHKELMAPYILHWEIIKKLKVLGFRQYDMWGIDAQKWPGMTRFKLGWGGETKEYPGSFDIPVSKFWYLAYNFARKIFRSHNN